MTCNNCSKYPGCMERSREYICREFNYDGGYRKTEKDSSGSNGNSKNRAGHRVKDKSITSATEAK